MRVQKLNFPTKISVASVASLPTLSMTGRTTRHHLFSTNLVFFFQVDAFGSGEVSVLPLHVEYLGLRPDKLLRLAMTRQTPFHLKSIFLIDGGHVVDLAVTR